MTRVIAVLTIGRSGSSALAGALHQAGIPFETHNDNMGISRQFNPKGHFEMSSWWQAGRALTSCIKMRETASYVNYLNDYSDIIARRNSEDPLIWGVKSTWFPWTMPHVLPLLPDHRVIVLRRGRESAIQSFTRHANQGHGASYSEAANTVDEATEAMERTADGLTCPVLDVRYEQIMRYPWRTLAGVLEFCYEDLAQVQIEQIERAVAWIDPELCHHA